MPRSINPALNQREFVTDFIKIYKQHQALWNVHCDDYKDVDKMSEGYSKLVSRMRQDYENATIRDCKSKVASLRAAYRKERNKVRSSGGKHRPKLWFYQLLSFVDVCEQRMPSNDVNSYDSPVASENEYNEADQPDSSFQIKESDNEIEEKIIDDELNSIEKKKKRKRKLLRQLKSGKVISTMAKVWVPRIEKPDDRLVDEFDVVGVNVANKLRQMDGIQRILAEEVINATLTQGLMGELSRSGERNVVIKHETSMIDI